MHWIIVRKSPRSLVTPTAFVAECLDSGNGGKGTHCKARADLRMLSANKRVLIIDVPQEAAFPGSGYQGACYGYDSIAG
ncbi:hypothetical protein [Paraburkholderia sp. HP33-1]|uniref:hypothetical protein n=1 Tax=Paraburkholderia sp. HP33-1 TaxID=2883243 RepID=UPI001F34215C|nr:hypothetical protein [Paraburkholderia sp. HP33-1]